jgi:hypothetical protein
VQRVTACEQLTVQAAVTGDRETTIWALVNNPLVGSYSAAELVDRLGEAHRAYLPAFAHEPSATWLPAQPRILQGHCAAAGMSASERTADS